MRWFPLLVLLFATALWSPATGLRAQGVTTAGIRGTVVTEDGSPVDGADIVVERETTGSTVETLVRNGVFLVQGLEVGGPYRVTVRGLGFHPRVRDDLYLTLGEPLELRFVLQASAIPLDTLRVVAAARDEAGGGTGTTIRDSLLHRLPTMNRDLYDFVGLTPQVATGIGLSGGGAGIRFNDFVIQGVPERSLPGVQPPEFGGGRSIPLSAVSEYQILLSPFDVRYGGFAGALVNAATRSGTNETRGAVFALARNERLARAGATDGLPYDRYQLGLAAGGPLRRDRLHYFVAAELQDRTSRADGPYVGQPAGAVERVPVDTSHLRRLDGIMRDWGLTAGSGGEVENHRRIGNLFARLDLALPEWNSRGVAWTNVGLSGHRNFSRAPGSTFRLSSSVNAQEFGFVTTGLQLHSTLRRTGGHNELLLAHRSNWTEVRPEVRQPIVEVEVPGTTGGTVTLLTGSLPPSQTPGFRSSEVNVRDDLTLPLGRDHVATIGVEAQWFRAWGGGLLNAWGRWTFSSLDSLAEGTADVFQIGRDFGSASVPFAGAHYAVYAGDRWQAANRLAVTFGLRAELLTIRERAPYNPAIDSVFDRRTDEMPVGRLHLSPRLGVVWDVFGTGRDRIRGGVGVFTGRPPLGWLRSAVRRYGIGIGLLHCGSGPGDHPPPPFDPAYRSPPTACADGAGLTTPPPGEVDLLDPDLRMARTLRATIAYERRLPWGLVGSLEGLVTRHLSDFLFVNRNLRGPQGIDRNGRVMYGTMVPTEPPGPVPVLPALRSDSFASVIELTNTGRNQSVQFSAHLEKRFSGGTAVTGSYTFSRVRDVQTPQRIGVPGRVNWASGRPVSGAHDDLRTAVSMNEVAHRIVLAGTYRTPRPRWSTEISLLYVGEAGRPFTYLAEGDLNADGAGDNDPIYVPRDVYDTTEIRFAGGPEQVSAQQEALERFIEGAPCLDAQRGSIMARNSCRSPWTHTTIASVRQFIPLGARRLEAQIDLFNLLNLIDPDWGRVRVPATPEVPASGSRDWARWTGSATRLELVGRTPGPGDSAHSIFRFPILPRWRVLRPESTFQIQLALRYRF